MEVEDEAESRRKLDEQKKKKLQKDLRDVDRLSFVSKEMQVARLMPEHQKFQKRSQRYKASRTRGDTCRRQMLQQKRGAEAT